ncbi:MAG: universal stress protein [Tepidisphaeraceae bacterium]
MKILLGYDGSDCSRGAIDDLRRAGLFDDTQAVVLTAAHVYMNLPRSCFEPGDTAGAAQAVKRAHALGEAAMADAKTTAEDGARRLRALFPTWKVSAEATPEPAHRALIARSESWGADLIVLGSHGRSALARFVLGSVSHQVLHAAHCSVRIGRGTTDPALVPAGPVKVMLGVDGSPDSATAVSAVAARRWPQGSEVRVVSVLDVRVSVASVTGIDPMAAAWMGQTTIPVEAGMDEDALQRVAREIERPGISVTTNLVIGDPKHALVDEAHAWNADCVFVGAKGHSRLERMIIGSVSSSIAARSQCSVEVVRSS